MTKTNAVVDDALVAECRKVTGLPTQRSLIEHALRELLRHGRQRKVLELQGRIAWRGDLRAWRKGRGIQRP